MAGVFGKKYSALAVAVGLIAGVWSTSSMACSSEPIIGSVCAMALPAAWTSFNNGTFLQAAGQTLSLNQYMTLYSLIGTTYGGNGTSNFILPDLRGRVILGAGTVAGTTTTYTPGDKGGNASITLLSSQLPATPIALVSTVDLSKVTATTTLSGLTGTADLSGVTASGSATGLVMNVVSAANGQATPANNYLGKNASPVTSSYSNATPDAKLNAGAISGTVNVAVAANTKAPVAMSATAVTTVGGTATASGTGSLGQGAAIPILPPYLVMTYFIAVNGIYPMRD